MQLSGCTAAEIFGLGNLWGKNPVCQCISNRNICYGCVLCAVEYVALEKQYVFCMGFKFIYHFKMCDSQTFYIIMVGPWMK